MNKIGKSFFTFTVGAAAGAMAGLLLAPMAGNKARKALKNRVGKISVSKEKSVGGGKKFIDLSSSGFEKRGIDDFVYHS